MIGRTIITDEVERISDLTEKDQILDHLVDLFRLWGADNLLIGGLPLPGRPIGPLVLRDMWLENRAERTLASSPLWSDPLLRRSLTEPQPFFWSIKTIGEQATESVLYTNAVKHPEGAIVVLPIHSLRPYQGCVLAAGKLLKPTLEDLYAEHYLCERAFSRLAEIGAIDLHRPGELSARERSVMELTALGRTANDIADNLDISQRTVHAHLHNASEKLRAANKTQTVVEAIRYAQIEF